MATKLYSIRGESYFAHLFKPDSYNGVENYKIGVIPASPEDWNTVKESGIKLRAKKVPDNKAEYLQFRRPAEPRVNDKGEEFGGGRPLLLLMKDGAKVELDKMVGNGSDVEVIFSAYDGKMGKGHRLETVIVHKLVNYEPADRDEEGYQSFPTLQNWGKQTKVEKVAGVVDTGPVEPKMPF